MTSSNPAAGRESVALFHSEFLGIGGAEILVATQAKYFENAGVPVRVVTLAFDETRWRSMLDGIPVQVVTGMPWSTRIRGKTAQLRWSVPRARDLLADCRAVMAINFPCNALLGAAGLPGRSVWWCTEPSRSVHLIETNPTMRRRVMSDSRRSTDLERDYTRRLAKYRRRSATRRGKELFEFDVEHTKRIESIYAISDFSRDNASRIYGRTDIEVIHPMVRFPERVTHRSGLDRSGLKVLAQSRLEIPKNLENVLRGFAIFQAKAPGARLHVVGEGPHRKGLEQLARVLGIANVTTFHGYLLHDELRRVYEACDVFALQPVDEPFGMVFPEAAARGLLLIGPDHGGPLEIMDGGKLGWPCDAFDPAALASALERVASLSDAEVDDRRSRADGACRSRYSEATIGPLLVRALR